jgi:SNF2 family DNA or RNA helicase
LYRQRLNYAHHRQRKANSSAVSFGQQQKLELDKLLSREVLLRRDKKDVLADKLPQKLESIVFCELSDIQRRVYKHILDLPDFDILIKSNAPCDCGVNKRVCLFFQVDYMTHALGQDFPHVSTASFKERKTPLH